MKGICTLKFAPYSVWEELVNSSKPKNGCWLLVCKCVCVCMYLGSKWGWSIAQDANISLPYICEIPKADIYKIVRITRGHGWCCNIESFK